jgi:hypothetical protein
MCSACANPAASRLILDNVRCGGRGTMAEHVYAVHAIRPDEICATEVIWTTKDRAEAYAKELSTDPGVLAGAMTRFVLNSPGERTLVALFVKGERQQVPHLSDDRQIAANGWIRNRSLWERKNATTWKEGRGVTPASAGPCRPARVTPGPRRQHSCFRPLGVGFHNLTRT